MSSIAKTRSASFRKPKSYKAQRNPRRKPTRPGALLRDEVLPALGVSVSQAADQMEITRQTLHRILAERSAVTAAMALRLRKLDTSSVRHACGMNRSRGWNCTRDWGVPHACGDGPPTPPQRLDAVEVFPTHAGWTKQVENRTRYFVPGLPLLKILLFIPLLT